MTVVSLGATGKLPTSTTAGALARSWARSWADEPVVHLTMDDLPSGLSESMAAELRHLEAANHPATSEEIWEEVVRTADALDRKLPESDQACLDWIEAYQELPADLFMDAMRRVRSAWHGAKMPNPGEVRRLIADDLAERRQDVTAIQSAVLKIRTLQARAESEQRAARCRRQQEQRREIERAQLRAAMARMDAQAS
jgi:hypothetical protein